MVYAIIYMMSIKVGIIGGGQLAGLTILEGISKNIDFAVLTNSKDSMASYLTNNIYTEDKLEDFIDFSDVITYEFEHINKKILEHPKLLDKLYPGVKPIELKQNRLKEKRFLKENNFITVPFYEAKNGKEAYEIALELKKELIIKTISNGYDGKGQYAIHRSDDLENIKDILISSKDEFLIEEFCYFDFEMSLIAGVNKENIVFMPMTKNIHKNGILLLNYTDDFSIEVQEKAKAIVSRLLKALEIEKGILTVEFFVKAKDIYINEFAPRVHNTGHHTLDDTEYSQFDLLLRSILDLPLYQPKLISPGGMVNIIGNIELSKDLTKSLMLIEGAKLYWYRKTPREGRKIGHINLTGESIEIVKTKIKSVCKILYPHLNIC